MLYVKVLVDGDKVSVQGMSGRFYTFIETPLIRVHNGQDYVAIESAEKYSDLTKIKLNNRLKMPHKAADQFQLSVYTDAVVELPPLLAMPKVDLMPESPLQQQVDGSYEPKRRGRKRKDTELGDTVAE